MGAVCGHTVDPRQTDSTCRRRGAESGPRGIQDGPGKASRCFKNAAQGLIERHVFHQCSTLILKRKYIIRGHMAGFRKKNILVRRVENLLDSVGPRFLGRL